jgi:putative FmdB family regulatory protein
MPLYDYLCEVCSQPYEARHGFDDPAPPCPHCGATAVHRLITQAPSTLKGAAANAGSSRSASKEQLRSKWAEETPKLREQLVRKLGEDVVNTHAPSLNTQYD